MPPPFRIQTPRIFTAIFACAMLAAAWMARGGEGAFPDFDLRPASGAASPTPGKQADAGKLRTRARGVSVDFDATSGAPKFVVSPREFLSGPSGQGRAIPKARADAYRADDPHRATKAFLDEYRGLFGHGSEALAAASVKRDFTDAHNGLHTSVWEQQVDGVPVFGAVLQSHTTRAGELVNVSSEFLADPVAAANRGAPGRAARMAAPAISAKEAVAAAAKTIGENVVSDDLHANAAPAGREKKQAFRHPALRNTEAQFSWLPMDAATLRLCWQVIATGKTSGEMFRMFVDAETGEVLLRQGLTNYISDATYRVFTGESPSPFSPSWPTPSTAQPALVDRTLVTIQALDTTASPNGWIDDGVNETRGNNVDAHLDLNADDVADTPRPQGSPLRVFDFALDLGQGPETYRDAAVTQLFYWCNWMHDKLYGLGFTEASGNFQVNNFGRGGAGNDAVQADAQDGSGTNNANFSTPPDGSSGRMQMYIFSGPTPDRDGCLDATVILHEYTHGLSNRLVGGGAGLSALASTGMGEGWSDFYAMALLSKDGDDPAGNYIVGGYVTPGFNGLTQNYYYGIRRYPYSTDLTKSPLTFRDIDTNQASAHTGVPRNPAIGNTATEIHNMGEVWCVTLWEARANLIAKYGFAVGNQLMLRIVTDGMKLSPANPNFLQARNAIVQADLVNNGGANRLELWSAFAKRGMGFSATAPASSTTVGVVEAFDIPDDLTVTPSTGFYAVGPQGGPFTGSATDFTLKNEGTAPLVWTAHADVTWLNFSSSGGTLAPGATTTVTVSLNANAGTQTAGGHNGSIFFTNTGTAHDVVRSAFLYIGVLNFFTELFDGGDNDTAFQSFTFTPDSSIDQYSVYREAAVAFPSDTSTGTAMSLADNGSGLVLLTSGATVKIYGTSYNRFFVGANGYVTFGSADSQNVESFSAHFSKPRIAALFRDLNPPGGGTIRRKQFSDRVAVTWQGVPEIGTTNSNNFQIEMFFDGRIRITILGIASTHGLIGLSRGTGIPQGFSESDFSAFPPPPPVGVSLPASTVEGAGTLTNAGTVTLPAAAPASVTVSLTSSNPALVTVPASVTISAGQSSANFSPVVLDDSYVNGTRSVTITATASGYSAGSQAMSVADNESADITLTLGNVIEGGTASGSVSIGGIAPADIAVSLTSGNTSRLTVPATVTIPAGASSATFTETAVENTLTDGAANVTVTAAAPGLNGASGNVAVADNDVHHYVFAAIGPTQIRGAPFSVTITAVDVNGVLLSTFGGSVNLGASAGVSVSPGSVQLAGGSATIPVTAGGYGGAVTLTASDVGGHTGASAAFDVTFGPLDHFGWNAIPAAQQVGVPLTVTMTAQDAVNNTVTTFGGAAALDCGPPARSIGAGSVPVAAPVFTAAQDARMQVIYPPGEIGSAGVLTSLSLFFTTPPGQSMNGWTIRLKHSPLAAYGASPQWESGWTVVHQSTQTISRTGWVKFVFTTPFAFDGTSNLMVDFSFHNASASSSGAVRGSTAVVSRAISFATNGAYGDPLAWSGPGGAGVPVPGVSTIIPDLKIGADRTVPVNPLTTGNFTAGVWSGSVAVTQAATGVTLGATSGGDSGESNVFDVIGTPALSVTPADGIVSAGNFGGPFTPTGATYTLTNTGTGPMDWTASTTLGLVTLTPAGGTLAAGASTTVTADVSLAVEPGAHTDAIAFTNATNGNGSTTRSVAVTVTLPAPVLAPKPMFTAGTTSAISWNAVAGAQHYEAQCSSAADFSAPLSSGFIAATGFTFTNLGDGRLYYRVRARRISAGLTFLSEWSAPVSSIQAATGPAVVVTSPALSMESTTTITGLAFDGAGIQSLTVNGVAASTTDGFAHWSADVALGPAGNDFQIEATNSALAPSTTYNTWNVYFMTTGTDFDHDGLPDLWEQQYGLDPFSATGQSGALGDLSGNGLPNLLKYAFGMNPLSPSVSGLPVTTIESAGPGLPRYLTLRYRRLLSPGAVQYSIETTSDMTTWTSSAADFEEIPPAVPTGDGLTETATVRVKPAIENAGPGAVRAARVRVTVPAP